MNTRLLALSILLSFTAVTLHAQNTSGKDMAANELDRRAQSIYFEILGPGVTYSFNYDTRFQNTLDGLGGRIGISYISADGTSIFTLPAMINYLLGNEGKYFEMGLGATYINANDDFGGPTDGNPNMIGTMVFGYRSQPEDGGFMFRAGFSPVFGQGDFIPYYPYLSLGFTF